MGLKPIAAACALAMSFGLPPASAASAAASEPAASPEQARPAANDRSRRVCRNVVRSGSRFATRDCRTQEEWDELAETSRRFRDGQNEITARDAEFNETRTGVAPRQ